MDNLHEVLKTLGVEHKLVGLPGVAYYNEEEDHWYYVEENEGGSYDIESFRVDGEPTGICLT